MHGGRTNSQKGFVSWRKGIHTVKEWCTYPIWTAAIIRPINITMGIIEILTFVRYSRIAPFVEDSSATTSTNVFIPRLCHMIDDCINVDPANNFRVQIPSIQVLFILFINIDWNSLQSVFWESLIVDGLKGAIGRKSRAVTDERHEDDSTVQPIQLFTHDISCYDCMI